MFKHILMPTDGSALSKMAIQNAMQWAQTGQRFGIASATVCAAGLVAQRRTSATASPRLPAGPP